MLEAHKVHCRNVTLYYYDYSLEANLSVELTLNCHGKVHYDMPSSSLSSLHPFGYFSLVHADGKAPFPLDLLILQNRESKRSANCSLATRDNLAWNIFNMLLWATIFLPGLRMGRAKELKGSESCIKTGIWSSYCHTKRSSMAVGHSKERDSVFRVTCPYQPFWLHCIPLSCFPAFLGPSVVSHPQSPSCFRIFAHSFPSLTPYSFFHYQINFNSSRKLSLISQISSDHLASCSLSTFIFYFRAFIPVCNNIFICDDLVLSLPMPFNRTFCDNGNVL